MVSLSVLITFWNILPYKGVVVFLVDIIRCSNVVVVLFKYLRKKLVPLEIREKGDAHRLLRDVTRAQGKDIQNKSKNSQFSEIVR